MGDRCEANRFSRKHPSDARYEPPAVAILLVSDGSVGPPGAKPDHKNFLGTIQNMLGYAAVALALGALVMMDDDSHEEEPVPKRKPRKARRKRKAKTKVVPASSSAAASRPSVSSVPPPEPVAASACPEDAQTEGESIPPIAESSSAATSLPPTSPRT